MRRTLFHLHLLDYRAVPFDIKNFGNIISFLTPKFFSGETNSQKGKLPHLKSHSFKSDPVRRHNGTQGLIFTKDHTLKSTWELLGDVMF